MEELLQVEPRLGGDSEGFDDLPKVVPDLFVVRQVRRDFEQLGQIQVIADLVDKLVNGDKPFSGMVEFFKHPL